MRSTRYSYYVKVSASQSFPAADQGKRTPWERVSNVDDIAHALGAKRFGKERILATTMKRKGLTDENIYLADTYTE